MTPREGTLSLEIKQVSDSGEFGGWLAVYNHEDLGGDVIERGAFTGSLQARGGRVRILMDWVMIP